MHMTCRAALAAAVCAAAMGAAAASRNALRRDVPDAALRWYDGTQLPLKGKGFTGVPMYERLPTPVADAPDLAAIRSGVRHAAGLNLRFTTDSQFLRIRWSLPGKPPYGWLNVAGTVAAGVDIYAEVPKVGWRFWANGVPECRTNTLDVGWWPNNVCTVYLPALGALESVQIGVPSNKTIRAARPYALPKPVVVYGASMVHGFCSSRPGMVWTSILSRMLDVEVINHGYAGNGKMEETMLTVLGDIDAAAYCFLNCGQNLSYAEMKVRFAPFLTRLHRRRPDVPILLGEYYYVNGPDAFSADPRRRFIADLVAELKAGDPAFWRNLYIVRMKDIFVEDGDGVVDAAHFNDRGAYGAARAFAAVLRCALTLE